MVAGLRERERMRDLFGRHVGEDVARAALDDRARELGGEVREVAVLFVDLVGSTALAADAPAAARSSRCSTASSRSSSTSSSRDGGWVNKFEGDAALCVFGAPGDRRRLRRRARSPPRATLHDAPARATCPASTRASASPPARRVAGNVGAEHRFEYTVIGDPVNEAARLCELAKRRAERVVASESILGRAQSAESARWSHDEEVVLRGRTTPTRLAIPRSGLRHDRQRRRHRHDLPVGRRADLRRARAGHDADALVHQRPRRRCAC